MPILQLLDRAYAILDAAFQALDAAQLIDSIGDLERLRDAALAARLPPGILWEHFQQSINELANAGLLKTGVSSGAGLRLEKIGVIVADKPSAGEVLDMLDKQGCDLIVTGTHGASWLKQRLLGSVAEEVVRRAHCPVMVVKARADQTATPAPQAPTKVEGI